MAEQIETAGADRLTVARVRDTERSIVVLGTTDAHRALAATGMTTETHGWGGTLFYDRGWTLHRDGTASHGRGSRAGVLFGNITRGEVPRG